jgi:4-amino-4-deoxy-L-arabinose transferase-like glycosyltransferase
VRRTTLLAIVALMAVGMGIRLANEVVWRPLEVRPQLMAEYTPEDPDALILGGDAAYYHYQARALAAGDGYADGYRWASFDHWVVPSASHPPAFATYLAGWTLLGVDSPQGHRIAASLLGLVTIAGCAAAAFRLAGDRAAIVAAAIAALYPNAWINDTMLLSEALAQAAVACFLYAAVRCWQERTWPWAAAAGVAAAVSTLTRNEQFVLFGVLLVLLVFRRGQRLWQGIRLAGVAGLAGLLLIAPWVGRNLATFDQTTVFTTGIGGALSAASCDETYSGDKLGWYHDCFTPPEPNATDAQGHPIFVDEDGNVLDETGRDAEPYRQAMEYIRSHLGEYPKVVVARVGRLWGWFRPVQTTRFEINVESRGGWQSWLALGGLYALEVVGVAGLVVMRRRRLPVSPALALIGVATFGAAITFGVGRYRSTAEIALVVSASIAGAALWDRWRPSTSEPSDDDADPPSSDEDGTGGSGRRDHSRSAPMPASTTQATSAATR